MTLGPFIVSCTHCRVAYLTPKCADRCCLQIKRLRENAVGRPPAPIPSRRPGPPNPYTPQEAPARCLFPCPRCGHLYGGPVSAERCDCAEVRKASPFPPQKTGIKFDTDKPRMSLLPFDALHEVAAVMTFGAKKYGEDNWRDLDNPRGRYASAMLRHYAAWAGGDERDPDSGLRHTAHMTCNALFCLWFDLVGKR